MSHTACVISVKRLRRFSGLHINIYKRVMKCNLFFFFGQFAQLRLSIYQKNIKRSKVQTKNYFELNLIKLFFFIWSLDDLSFAKKKNTKQANWPVYKIVIENIMQILIKILSSFSDMQLNSGWAVMLIFVKRLSSFFRHAAK